MEDRPTAALSSPTVKHFAVTPTEFELFRYSNGLLVMCAKLSPVANQEIRNFISQNFINTVIAHFFFTVHKFADYKRLKTVNLLIRDATAVRNTGSVSNLIHFVTNLI